MRSKGWLFNSLVALAASVMLCAGSPALPQSYPSQPIRIIVPTAPGGVADIAARTLAQRLNEIGKTAVVENRTGGGGAIAAEFVAKSAPDGYTVYVGFHATQAILPHLQKLSYDAEKDFAPVTVAVKSANILVVNPSVPAQTLEGSRRLCKSKSWKADVCLPGERQFRAHRRRATQAGSRNRHRSRTLSRCCACGAGPHRRPRVHDVRYPDAGHTAGRDRQGPCACDHLGATGCPVPRRPDNGGGGFPATRRRPLVRLLRSGEDAASGHRLALCRGEEAFSTSENRERFAQHGLTTMVGTPEETAAFVAAESKRWSEVIKQGEHPYGVTARANAQA